MGIDLQSFELQTVELGPHLGQWEDAEEHGVRRVFQLREEKSWPSRRLLLGHLRPQAHPQQHATSARPGPQCHPLRQ